MLQTSHTGRCSIIMLKLLYKNFYTVSTEREREREKKQLLHPFENILILRCY